MGELMEHEKGILRTMVSLASNTDTPNTPIFFFPKNSYHLQQDLANRLHTLAKCLPVKPSALFTLEG